MSPFILSLAMITSDFAVAAPDQLSNRIDSIWPLPEEEKWMEVGWRLDLFAARKEALETGKPIFMWIMNGHPTGCT